MAAFGKLRLQGFGLEHILVVSQRDNMRLDFFHNDIEHVALAPHNSLVDWLQRRYHLGAHSGRHYRLALHTPHCRVVGYDYHQFVA